MFLEEKITLRVSRKNVVKEEMLFYSQIKTLADVLAGRLLQSFYFTINGSSPIFHPSYTHLKLNQNSNKD